MKKLLQINSVIGRGSTGRIVDGISAVARENGWESHVAYGRKAYANFEKAYNISNQFEVLANVAWTRMFDNDSPISRLASRRLEAIIELINPDVIHLHNLHGYYLHCPSFFEFLCESKKPIIWTLHDCWSFTGHCCYFKNCDKWKRICDECPLKKDYPSSYIFDNSNANFKIKKRFSKLITNLTMVPVSDWLNSLVGQSIFKDSARTVIKNGIDLHDFYPRQNIDEIKAKYRLEYKNIILGVANVWTESKGYFDMINLAKHISDEAHIVMVGVNLAQQKEVSQYGITGILKTQSVNELAELYSIAGVLANPTYHDNYPTVNLESIACGTPVVTYKTGGSPESVDEGVGMVIPCGDIEAFIDGIKKVIFCGKNFYKEKCLLKATSEFDKKSKFLDYILLYDKII